MLHQRDGDNIHQTFLRIPRHFRRICFPSVRNIYQPVDQNAYTVGGIESFKEASRRNRRMSVTRVLQFTELTPQIAEGSVYEYLEEELGMNIVTSKRTLTVEHVTQVDEKYIDLKGYNCMAVITSQTFNDEGVQFEYTQSRHHPDYFQFQDVAVRKKSGAMEGSLKTELRLAGA